MTFVTRSIAFVFLISLCFSFLVYLCVQDFWSSEGHCVSSDSVRVVRQVDELVPVRDMLSLLHTLNSFTMLSGECVLCVFLPVVRI